MRLPVTIVTVALALGCAPARQGITRVDLIQGARAGKASARHPVPLLAQAEVVLEARELAIATRAHDRIVTAPRELDVPCGASSCLARELVVVSVANGAPRVEVLRGVFEPATRSWSMALAPAAAEEVAVQQASILRAILRGGAVGSAGDARGR